MIKKLNIKMLISMFILVITVFITSSCFAAETVVLNYADYISSNHLPSLPDVKNYLIENGYDISNTKILAAPDYEGGLNGINFWFIRCDENINLKLWYSSKADDFYRNYCFFVSNSDDDWNSRLTNYYAIEVLYIYNNPKGYYYAIFEHNGKDTTNATPTLCYSNKSLTLFDINEINTYDMDGNIIFDATKNYISASYEFQTDSSAKVKFALNKTLENYSLYYSLSGVEPNVSLTDPVKLRNPIQYYIGTSSLTVKPNSKVYYALYDSGGNCLEQDVLAVPAYDVVYENSDKDIDYEIEYNSDNTEATIYASITNGEFSDKLYYSYYPPDLNGVYEAKLSFPRSGLTITKNCDIYLIATDAFDNVFTADYATINKLGTIPEDLFKVNVLTEEKTVMLYPRLYGFDTDKYYIESSANLDTFTSSDKVNFYINNDKKGDVKSLNGQYFQVGSNGELKFYQSVGTSNITVTFLIKNEETDAICLTRTVSFKIGLEGKDDTGVTGSTTNGVEDDSFLISDSSNNYGGDYQKVTWDDVKSQISTNGDFWQLVKTIFSCLPKWITGPLFFFISGVVVICLTKVVLSVVTSIFG